MGSIRRLVSLIVMVSFASLMNPQLAWPLLYQCREPNGAMVFTDSTAQLQHCLVINTGTVARLSYPAGAAAPPRVVPVAPEPPGIPDQPDVVEEPAPDPPAEDDAPPGSLSHPPCIAGINPLNPLGGPGCPPTENSLTVQPDLPPGPSD